MLLMTAWQRMQARAALSKAQASAAPQDAGGDGSILIRRAP
jgi:hypothetical protein